MDRRKFLMNAGQLSAGALMMGYGFNAGAQSRRIVTLGGFRVKVVDIHAHCDILEVAPLLEGTSMADANLNRPLGPEWLARMDSRGIDVAAISANRFWWYDAEPDLARQIVRLHDDKIAEWCDTHSDRCVQLSSPALQFPELAAEQLEYAVTELGAKGASVLGHARGEPPSTEKYDPFWAKAEELDVPVFMHPDGSHNIIQPGVFDGPGFLGNVMGNPLETTLFLARLIYDGTLDRFPGLNVVAAHGGGYLPHYLGRFEQACSRGNTGCVNEKTPAEYLRTQIFADTMVFNEEGLRHLVAVMGVSQVVYGTDIPHGWADTLDLVLDSPTLSNAEKEAILGGNLVELLKLEG
ncbi:MAG: amidohydrolase family protein [Candidatus Rariloculaceae bacterium]